MRQHIRCYVGATPHHLSSLPPALTLLDWLPDHPARPGSKAGRSAFDKMAAQMRIELQASNEALALASAR